MPEATNTPKIDVVSVQAEIARLLKFTTFQPECRYWLNTGSRYLNAALGSPELGLPYGRIYELSGVEHGGKTAMATVIGGIAQRDGAAVGYMDLEDSRDGAWAYKLGLDFTQVLSVYPKLVYEGKKKDKPRLQSAEELFAEAEAGMAIFSSKGYKKQFWLVDSIAMLNTQRVIDAGAQGQNMRTNADRAMFLSTQLPMWAGLAANYNAMIFLVNQLRERVGMVFGDPTYTPGGRALRHTCGIRARIKRMKNGQLRQGGKVVGLVGVISNKKNKAGEGSNECEECGFRIIWNRPRAKIRFMSVTEAEAVLKGEGDE